MVSFSFDLGLPVTDPNVIQQDGDIGSSNGGDYALVGPFTVWRLTIDPKLNDPSLSLKGVTKVDMEFWGENLPFQASAAHGKGRSAVSPAMSA